MIALAAALVATLGSSPWIPQESRPELAPPDPAAAGPVTGFSEIDPAVWITPGATLPPLELPRIDGQGSLDLADLRGRKLLLIQFASW